MSRIEVRSKVGPDGVLRLTVPLPPADANREVRVTVESIPRPTMTQEEWSAMVMRLAGSITDPEFRYRGHEGLGELEERDPLS